MLSKERHQTATGPVDRHAPNERLDYNRPAQGICALLHLWHRRRRVEDRDKLLRTVARHDQAAAVAIAAAHERIRDADPRLIKAAVRIAFTCCRWRWEPHDEDAATREAYEEEKAGKDVASVAAEVAWLDGGPEPTWPELPEETPSFSRQPRATVSPNGEHIDLKSDGASLRRRSREAIVHANDQELSRWLSLLNVEGCARPGWYLEIIESYAPWSARINGHGYSADAELSQTPNDWNNQFYVLVSSALMDAADYQFLSLLQPIIELPDSSFCDVAETVIHAADVHYFNEPDRPSARASALRQKMVARAIELNRWSWDRRKGELGIDIETGPMIGMLLMNLHSPFSGAKTYLVPAVFDRVDPLLETLRPMMPGGPTAFIAICTMNTLNVAPTARHLDFLLNAVETWLEVTNGDRSMWHELGIGRKVTEWLNEAAVDDPSLYGRSHPARSSIDAILGRLVSFGVSEAHELEVRIQTEANSQTPH